MAKVKLLNLGSRRRIAQIRWTRAEILHAIALLLLMAGVSLWIALWLQSHTLE